MASDDMASFSLLGGYDAGSFAPANFQDAEDSRPSGAHMEALGGNQDAIQGIVQQTLVRHITEALPPQGSPQLTSYSTHQNNWRKRLREMMIRQNENILGFLYRPPSEHAVVGSVEAALRRYALRQDVEFGAIRTFKSLLEDCSGNTQGLIASEIETCLAAKGTSSLPQLRSQVNGLLDLYKETGDKLLDCENQLKLRLEKMDKIQRRVSTLMELQTNEGTPELVGAIEKYLNFAFQDMTIEQQYKQLLFLYQKHLSLREAIQIFKTGSQIASEPLCPICITESIGMAIVPCGHTFCQTCARRMMTECGVCRGRVRDRLKLFVG